MANQFLCNTTTPVVATTAGKLRGYLADGIYHFFGIKYADAGRFQKPTPVKPWEGVRDALNYGYVCPLLTQDRPSAGEMKVPHRYWPMDENCQYLNVWTQTIGENAKKPVMVWIHGGGFFAGSGIEQQAYDGENLCQYGDVVVVSLNHRLNILGYLDFSPFGTKYENSANAGHEDLIAALKWIRDNIAAFGGDPENVTVFGQSGGGRKIWNLMQMPEADGLFHKAIVQSGVMEDPALPNPADGTVIVKALMEKLELIEVEELERVPYAQLAAAYNEVAPKVAATGAYVGNTSLPNESYKGHPFRVGFTEHAKTIPLMVGCVLDEFKAFRPGRPDRNTMSETEAYEMIAGQYGEKYAERLIALFRQAYPGKNLCDLADMDTSFRNPSKKFALQKGGHRQAPTWSYVFALDFPIDEGSGAWHCSEIPFVFHNTQMVPVCTIPGVTARLEHQMTAAWTNFAHYGNPNDPSLPEWPACTGGDEACMIFDEICEVRHNHDHDLLELLLECEKEMAKIREAEQIEIQH